MYVKGRWWRMKLSTTFKFKSIALCLILLPEYAVLRNKMSHPLKHVLALVIFLFNLAFTI